MAFISGASVGIGLVMAERLLVTTASPVVAAGRSVAAYTLYPEMVETAFSAPYQKNNPYAVMRKPDEVAERMLEMVEGCGPEDSGRFVNIWSGEDILW